MMIKDPLSTFTDNQFVQETKRRLGIRIQGSPLQIRVHPRTLSKTVREQTVVAVAALTAAMIANLVINNLRFIS